MHIFVLEDDAEAMGIIDWLIQNGHTVRHVFDLRDAYCYLFMEPEIYDRLIFDVAVPGVSFHDLDGVMRDFNHKDGLNGLRFLLDNYDMLYYYHGRIALYTAYAMRIKQMKIVPQQQEFLKTLPRIDKTSDELIVSLREFLSSKKP